MTSPAMRLVPVDGAELQVEATGTGEPVVLVQTALTAGELRPLADHALRNGYRRVLYHRRGYAGSSPVHGPGSIARDAADCHALLDALGIQRAHVVGLSYSAAVALQLAADAPNLMHSLTLLEPPPVHVPSAREFRAACTRLQATRRAHGPAAALDEFMTLVMGPDWWVAVERDLPGATEQMQRDAATFFDTDIPALLDWQFTAADARRITCPVLYLGGTASGPWFAEVRELMLSWLPQAENVVIAGADHALATTHPAELATALLRFLQRHPIKSV